MEGIPEYLYNLIKEQYKEELTSKIIDGFSVKRKVSFRVNNLKMSLEEVETVLNDNNISFEKVSWYDKAYIVDCDEEKMRELNMYQEGAIYLQSLSSMIPPLFIEPKENEDILDMAAAPGGKTTELAALSDNKSHITACEMNKIRYERLKFNIDKQGAKSVYVMQKDARQLEDFFAFDKILLDAPCTGSGTININDNIRFEPGYLQKHVKTQSIMLEKAAKLLKKGHEMVYSTCSILKQENEEVVLKVLEKYNLEIVPIKLEGVPCLPTTLEGTMVVMPTEYFEGFYVAKLRKK